MSSDWQLLTLGEFLQLQRGHDLTAEEQLPGQVPVMGSAGPNGTHSIAKAKGPGVVVGRSGSSIGRVHFSPVDFWPHNTCLYVTDFFGNNPRFAFYLLQTLNLATYNSGSAQPSLNRNYIYSIKLRVPRRPEQDRIVELLEVLEDEIAVLKQTNTTLEAIAQAIFKSWFIDFDPVKAKVEGRTPAGIDDATSALFPGSFAESKSGLVPYGWEVKRLDSILELAYGKALKASDRVTGEFPVYGSGGVTGFHDHSLVAGPGVVVGRKGTVGSLYWEDRPFFPIDTVFYVRSSLPLTYCYYLLQTLGLEEMNTDAAVPGLNRRNAYRLEICAPPGALIKAFDDLVGTIRASICSNFKEADTLASIRDTLLPRLISGKLRIPEVDEIVEAVAA